MAELYSHPVLGEITIAQSRRSRRIAIAVKPSGEVRLSFPVSVSLRRALAFLNSKTEWVSAAQQRMAKKSVARPTFTSAQIEELRREAKKVLPPKVEQFARMFGFRYNRVAIRAVRSKWGSCTSENNISLSLYLMTLPEHLIDYVIIHELCHTVHHNHSAKFHSLLNKHLDGREKELHRELRGYSTGSVIH